MRYQYLLVFLLAALLFCGCGSQFQILESSDTHRPGVTNTYFPITIKKPSAFDLDNLNFKVGYSHSDAGSYYYFAFHFVGKKMIYLRKAVFIIDGKEFSFASRLEPEREIKNSLVSEYMGFRIEDAVISEIRKAKNVEVNVIGDEKTFNFSFNDKDIKNKFELFLLEVERKYMIQAKGDAK